MPEWLETSRTSRMIVIAVTKVPDPRGNVRHLVTEIHGRITMSIEGALLKVSVHVPELTIQPGREVLLPVKIARSAKLVEPVKLELDVPEALQGLLKAEPVIVTTDRSEATVRIIAANDPRLTGEHTFTIRATAIQPGNLRVMSEASVLFTTAETPKK
jgi:hypothetical protein